MLIKGYAVALALSPVIALAQNPQEAGGGIGARGATAGATSSPLVITRRVEPGYSTEARAAGLQGTVLMAVDVAPNGEVSQVQVRRGLGLGLDERAIAAVKQWQYNTGGQAAHDAVELDFQLIPNVPWEVEGWSFTRAGAPDRFRFPHPSLRAYTNPAVSTCTAPASMVSVHLQIGDDGIPADVRAEGPVDAGIAAAVVRAVESWRFFPGTEAGIPGTTSGTVVLGCRSLEPPSDSADTATPGIYKIGQGVSQPSVFFKVDPLYSEEARQAKYSGTVLLGVVVTGSGRVADVRVVKTLGLGLDEQAILAVKQWRFRPGMKAGKPVNVRATIEINFKLL